MPFRRALLLLALASGLLPTELPAQLAPPPLPQDVGAEAAWKAFRERPQAEELGTYFEQLGGLIDDNGDVRSDACASTPLAVMEPHLSVSIPYWWFRMECAELQDDEAELERSLQAFAALARHALEQAPRRHSNEAPTPILHEFDLWMLIRGLELELGYVYLDASSYSPHAAYHVALWDPVEKREHLLTLDFLGIYTDMIERSGEPRTLLNRLVLLRTFLRAFSELGAEMPAARALRFAEASRGPASDQLPQLSALAAEGDFHAASRLFDLCRTLARSRCTTQAVDALLPFAEQGLAEALSMLGSLHANGIGVRRDTRAAAELYARADERLGGYEASLASGRQWLQPPIWGGVPKPLRKRLEQAAADGIAEAKDLLILSDIAEALEKGPPKRVPRKLLAAAESSSPWVRTGLGALMQEADTEQSLAHLAHGARMGSVMQVMMFLDAVDKSSIQPLEHAELVRLHERAGYGGWTPSALWLGRHYETSDPKRARLWMLGAANLGDEQAMYEAAVMLVDQWNGDQTLAIAAELLEGLLKLGPSPEAEVLLADLLIQGVGGVEADRPRAARMLRALHAKGHDEGSRMLAANLAMGRLEAEADDRPREVLEALANKGHAAAMAALAQMIYTGHLDGGPEDAWRWWRKAIEAETPGARNNLAWTQCVSADPRFRNVEEGLAEAQRMGDPAALPTAYRDTVATCFAANGDFARAIELQQSILDELQAEGGPEAGLSYFRDKLAQFQRSEVFLEERARFGGAEPESEAPAEADPAPEQ